MKSCFQDKTNAIRTNGKNADPMHLYLLELFSAKDVEVRECIDILNEKGMVNEKKGIQKEKE